MRARTRSQAFAVKTAKRSFATEHPGFVRAAMLMIPLLLLALTSFGDAHAQEPQTLFQGRVMHGGFGGPVVKFSNVRGEMGVWVGGRGGWLITSEGAQSVSIGGGGYGLTTAHAVPDPDAAGFPNLDDLRARVGYGGFEVEYANRSYRLVHWTASTLVGAGSMAIERGNIPLTADEPAFFVLEPALNGELNVTQFLRLHAGVSYRLTRGVDRAGFTDRDFSGVNGSLTLKFGRFP